MTTKNKEILDELNEVAWWRYGKIKNQPNKKGGKRILKEIGNSCWMTGYSPLILDNDIFRILNQLNELAQKERTKYYVHFRPDIFSEKPLPLIEFGIPTEETIHNFWDELILKINNDEYPNLEITFFIKKSNWCDEWDRFLDCNVQLLW